MAENLRCQHCGGRLEMKHHDADGWYAYLECWGCDARGPSSEFKYEDQEDAAEDALARYLGGLGPPPSEQSDQP